MSQRARLWRRSVLCELVSVAGDVNIPWSLPNPKAGGKNERRKCNAVGLVSRRSNQIAVCV